MPVKIGDTVKIVDRESTPADVKSGLFYNHFRNLVGTVERIYDDKTICVDVDSSTLPQDISDRHGEIATEMRDKWLDGLSQEARSRLSEQDKQFRLSYKVVVAEDDVQVVKGGGGKPARPAAATSSSATSVPKAKKEKEPSEPKRPTLEDLDVAEQQYLESRRKGSSDGGGE